MIKYLGTIPPGTRVAIFTMASRLRMLQGATTDSATLLAVLDEKKSGTHASPLLASNAENDAYKEHINFMEAESMAPPATNLTNVQAAVDPVNAIKQFLADTTAYETDARTQLTLQSLQQLARYLSATPGRKNVLWFSGSFPTGILPNPDLPDASSVVRNFEPEVRRTTALLASSHVALYPIAAEGLSTDSVYQANGGVIGQKRPSFEERDLIKQMQNDNVTRDSNHNIMEILAEDTGGTAFYNTNGLGDALARVINNGTRYYTLTYIPADPHMDGKFRRIHVKLRDAKYKLAYRRGYYADPALPHSTQKADNDPLMPFMARNFPDLSQIVYKISVVPAKTQPAPDAPRAGANQDLKAPITRYAVDFAVAVQDLKLDPTPDGGRHGNIEVMLIAYDREGKPVNMVITKGDLNLQAKVYASMVKQGLQMHKEIDVPQQPIYLRTGIYDLASDTAGTLGIPLTESPTTPAAAAK
jgi:VWFA-related protein